MMIRTYDSDYIVIRHVMSGTVRDVYICQRAQDKKKREYTVIRVKDLGLCQKLLRFFTDNVDENKFTDFVECFTFESRLNFVFIHSPEKSLMDKLLQEQCSFYERLEIAHKLLERLIFLNIPYAMAADGLMLEHITVSPGLDVRFNYELAYTGQLNDYTLAEVGLNIDDVFRRIFSEELDKNSCQEIKDYLAWLEKGEYESWLDIFYKFNRYYAVLRQKDALELATPRTLSFKAWGTLKKMLNWLKRLLMLALAVGALVYLIMSIRDLARPATSGNAVEPVDRYDYIGTVDILDNNLGNNRTDWDGVSDQ